MTREYREIQESKYLIESIECDLCGKSRTDKDVVDLSNVFATISWQAGYDSEYDMTNFQLDICDECINKHAKRKKKRKLAL